MGVRPLRSSLSLSVILHAVLFSMWVLLAGKQAAHRDTREWVMIDLAPTSQKPKAADDASKQRIVQTTPGRAVEQAPEGAHLGERNQVVDRQTVSRTRKIQIGQTPKATGSSANPTQAAPAPQAAASPRLGSLGLAMLPKPATERLRAPEWRSADAGAPASDFIRGMRESDATALNTREYVFYGYFQRIRERLDLAWNASLKDQLGRLYRSGRQLASDMEHKTEVLVTLNGSGEVVRVQLLEESGTRDLDDAAIGAFNQAGPFPNPPKGIVDAEGLIRIRWDFVLRS